MPVPGNGISPASSGGCNQLYSYAGGREEEGGREGRARSLRLHCATAGEGGRHGGTARVRVVPATFQRLRCLYHFTAEREILGRVDNGKGASIYDVRIAGGRGSWKNRRGK